MRSKLLFLLLLVAFSCEWLGGNEVTWPYGVKYEVFVMSFADGDGNGKGDFKGLAAKLDYLEDLGVNGIWLMPIMPSDTYHKYHVNDFRNIDPDYGTIADFKHFVNEAHKREIKVITDFVINHTGNLHPWFIEAQKGKNNPYHDWYVWASKDSIRNQINRRERALDSNNLQKWHPVRGDTLGEYYYGYFNSLTPDLNMDNPKVREEIVDIAKFWLIDMRVDGFRMDAARHIFPDDRVKDNHEFWVWFRNEMEKIKPNVYLVGEVWASSDVVAPYLKGLPSLFNFDLGYAITDVAKAGKDTIGLVKKYKEVRDYYKSINKDYLDATFVKNHDQTRLLTEFRGDVNKAKMAAAILLTMPGTPYLYYGEEEGMLGDKLQTFEDRFGPDAYVREPFIWDSGDAGHTDRMQTSWEKPRFSTDSTVVPVNIQMEDEHSIYNFYRRLINVRNKNATLTYGDIDYSGFDIAEVVSFKRKFNDQQVLVLHNVSDVEITIPLTDGNKDFTKIVYDMSDSTSINENEITLSAYNTLILKQY
jgi:alpha-amylase